MEIITQAKKYIELARLKQPAGIVLLALPCFFGIALAAKNVDISQLALIKISLLFAFGSIIMRSAGCVVNDLLDIKFDSQVSRTKSRPLASGILSKKQALVFLAILLCFGLVILLQFNFYTILSGIVALILVALYPLMKRITFYPQLFLGITFNYGILMADLAINNKISAHTLILYSSAIIWTLIYDTIYAFQDIEDDLKIGVKSSAIKFSKNPKLILSFLSVIMFALLGGVGFMVDFGASFYIIIFLACFAELFLILNCRYELGYSCLAAFKKNILIGSLILLALITQI